MNPFKKRSFIPNTILMGGPSENGASPGVGLKSRFKNIYERSVDQSAPLNRAAAHICNTIDWLGGAAYGVVAAGKEKEDAKKGPPDYLGEHNFRRIRGRKRDILNQELHKQGRLGRLDRIDDLIGKHRYLPELKKIENMAVENPRSAASMLINWYGTLGWQAPDSEFFDEKHEKMPTRPRW